MIGSAHPWKPIIERRRCEWQEGAGLYQNFNDLEQAETTKTSFDIFADIKPHPSEGGRCFWNLPKSKSSQPDCAVTAVLSSPNCNIVLHQVQADFPYGVTANTAPQPKLQPVSPPEELTP